MTLKHYCNYIPYIQKLSRDMGDIQETQIELIEMKTLMSEKNTQIGSMSN